MVGRMSGWPSSLWLSFWVSHLLKWFEERFDLLVSKEMYFAKPVQALLAVVTSPELKQRATSLGGYAVREAGKVACVT